MKMPAQFIGTHSTNHNRSPCDEKIVHREKRGLGSARFGIEVRGVLVRARLKLHRPRPSFDLASDKIALNANKCPGFNQLSFKSNVQRR
jgi:hypothetical protein